MYLQRFNFICDINKERNYIPGEEGALASLYICIYVRIYVYMYAVCMYVCMHIRMYVTV